MPQKNEALQQPDHIDVEISEERLLIRIKQAPQEPVDKHKFVLRGLLYGVGLLIFAVVMWNVTRDTAQTLIAAVTGAFMAICGGGIGGFMLLIVFARLYEGQYEREPITIQLDADGLHIDMGHMGDFCTSLAPGSFSDVRSAPGTEDPDHAAIYVLQHDSDELMPFADYLDPEDAQFIVRVLRQHLNTM